MADKPVDRAQMPERIGFHYLKSPLYRTVHVDGAHGGVTPRGFIDASLYSERLPIPNYLMYALEETGRLGKEVTEERVSKSGVIREVEVSLLFDLPSAKAFAEWMNRQIAVLEKATKSKSEEAK